MPDFASLEAFGRELDRWQQEYERQSKQRITRAQAEAGVDIAIDRFSGVLGGDPKFSGWAPEIELQVKETRTAGAVMMPTRTGAGPATVAAQGRNQGDVGLFQGPALNHRTGVTSRNKRGNLIRRRTGRRQWNGYTDPKISASEIVSAIESKANEIAETEHRRSLQRHFDVD